MSTLISIIVLLLVTAGIFYLQLARRRGAVIFALTWLLVGTVEDAFLHPVALIVLLAILAVVLHSGFRRMVLSKPARKALQKMMPPMSATEKEALDAGTTWWEKDLFSGKPDWNQFDAIELSSLTEREQAFVDGEVDELCAMLDEWDIHHHRKDMPEEVWQFIKDKGFLGLIIPEEYGGLHFSPYAQSRVVSKIASRSTVASVSVMVPNSLGPGELLVKYGTKDQCDYWLPRLARGEEIPCFGLTSPEAGSDAGAIPDRGVVCRGEYKGEETLGIRLSFSKRWITLAPVATVVGLAFKLYDPDNLLGEGEERGICCALVPADLPGMEIGRRHNPGAAFMNGPLTGKDVFIPMELLIGGQDYIGRGWQMLVECLGAGRGISLPALSTAAGEMSYLTVGAFARIRRQFGIEVGKFEGVQEATAEIAGGAYMLEAYRAFVTRGLADGAPSVMTAMAKYHATETMRRLVNHGMDVLGGRGIQLGPRNFMALVYQTIPIAITVEGANILTRSMMIFGQGAIRCHPYLADELLALEGEGEEVEARFDELFSAHLGHTFSTFSRAALLGVSGGLLGKVDQGDGFTRRWLKQLDRYCAVFAATADIALVTLGGDLKRREMLSARLGDAHSQLVIACAIIKYRQQQPVSEAGDLHAEYALRQSFAAINEALAALYRNMPQRWMGRLLKLKFFPYGFPVAAPDDELIRKLGGLIMSPNPVREALSEAVYLSEDPEDATGRINVTYQRLLEVERHYDLFLQAEAKGVITGNNLDELAASAVEKKVLTAEQAQKVADYDRLRYECLLTDAFDRQLDQVDIRIARP